MDDDDDDVQMELAIEHNEDELLEHIILPRILPQEKSSKLYETELDLMKKMVANVENMANVIPPKTVELFQRLHRVHMICSKENVSHEINALRPGDTFAMFVHLQHTAIMIHVPSNESVDDVKNVIVSTIPTLHPGEIYKHDSDFEVIFDISTQNNNNCFSIFFSTFSFFIPVQLSGASNQSRIL